MTQWVKKLAIQPGVQSVISGTHIERDEKTISKEVFSVPPLHVCTDTVTIYTLTKIITVVGVTLAGFKRIMLLIFHH